MALYSMPHKRSNLHIFPGRRATWGPRNDGRLVVHFPNKINYLAGKACLATSSAWRPPARRTASLRCTPNDTRAACIFDRRFSFIALFQIDKRDKETLQRPRRQAGAEADLASSGRLEERLSENFA
jgi:hypothetical protein